MLDRSAIVRVGCAKCKNIFDVDLRAIVEKRGRHYSLIDAAPVCKVTNCRGRAYFIAARSMLDPLFTLVNASMDPFRLNGLRPIDIEPDEPEPPDPVAQRVAA
ncbi:MAG TPA: hypothetical protein VF628_10980 [Allosphingosinicella sp.]|jgi:hypothetical protein